MALVKRTHCLPIGKRSSLARRIGQQFSTEEIDSLAYDVGVLADELAGKTRQARAENLVELAFRRGILYALARQVEELRPKEQL